MVLVTTPPQPASNARRMFASDSVGGAEESMNGFAKRIPVNVVPRSTAMADLPSVRSATNARNHRAPDCFVSSCFRGRRAGSLRSRRALDERSAADPAHERAVLDDHAAPRQDGLGDAG